MQTFLRYCCICKHYAYVSSLHRQKNSKCVQVEYMKAERSRRFPGIHRSGEKAHDKHTQFHGHDISRKPRLKLRCLHSSECKGLREESLCLRQELTFRMTSRKLIGPFYHSLAFHSTCSQNRESRFCQEDSPM